MLSILDRYFLRELAQTVAATVVVLLVIVAGSAFARVLQQVANGSFPASVMFQVLGLRTLDGLTNMMPLASFIGVLMGLGRMYRESEMHVLASSGMGPRGLLRPVLILGAVLVAITALVSLWLGPWAVRTSDAMVADGEPFGDRRRPRCGAFHRIAGQGRHHLRRQPQPRRQQAGAHLRGDPEREQGRAAAPEGGQRDQRRAVPGKRRRRPFHRVQGRLAIRHPAGCEQLAADAVPAQRHLAVQRAGRRGRRSGPFEEQLDAVRSRTTRTTAPSLPGARTRRR